MLVLLCSYGTHTYVLFFPTRRSSDLDVVRDALLHGIAARAPDGATPLRPPGGLLLSAPDRLRARGPSRAGALLHHALAARSEEHTSELQSHSDLVCRLLLEKKKHNND